MRRAYDPDRHHRRSIRLQGYDYSQAGAYFVTVVTQGRECLFGVVVDGQMRLNEAGQVVQGVWNESPGHYPGVILDAFVVMPNHVHGIVVLHSGTDGGPGTVGAGLKPAPTTGARAPTQHGLPEIVRGFKTFSARHINAVRNTAGVPLWQRGYYEHVVRDEEVLNRIRQYIADNPLRWAYDRENPLAVEPEPEDAWRA